MSWLVSENIAFPDIVWKTILFLDIFWLQIISRKHCWHIHVWNEHITWRLLRHTLLTFSKFINTECIDQSIDCLWEGIRKHCLLGYSNMHTLFTMDVIKP